MFDNHVQIATLQMAATIKWANVLCLLDYMNLNTYVCTLNVYDIVDFVFEK